MSVFIDACNIMEVNHSMHILKLLLSNIFSRTWNTKPKKENAVAQKKTIVTSHHSS